MELPYVVRQYRLLCEIWATYYRHALITGEGLTLDTEDDDGDDY